MVDVWALGVTIFRLVSDKESFEHEDDLTAKFNIKNILYTTPSEFSEDLTSFSIQT